MVGGPVQVLLVDDMMSVRALLKLFLQEFNFSYAEAANGAEGLTQARYQKPDLVVVDLMMPVMDGSKFLEEVRKDPNLMDIPVIVLSAADEQLALTPAHGRTFVARKPIDPKTLKNVVREALNLV